MNGECIRSMDGVHALHRRGPRPKGQCARLIVLIPVIQCQRNEFRKYDNIASDSQYGTKICGRLYSG